MENLLENALAWAMTEVGKGAARRCLEEVETVKKAEPDVIAESRSQLAVSTDLAQVDWRLSLKLGIMAISLCHPKVNIYEWPRDR